MAKVQYLTDRKGKKKAVVIPIRPETEELLEELFDIHLFEERRKENDLVPLEEVEADLKRSGLL